MQRMVGDEAGEETSYKEDYVALSEFIRHCGVVQIFLIREEFVKICILDNSLKEQCQRWFGGELRMKTRSPIRKLLK